MAQVGHRRGPKRTLGTFEVETMGAEGVEDDADVLQVLRPRGAIDQYVIKKQQLVIFCKRVGNWTCCLMVNTFLLDVAPTY
jgi:hypothetical protein